MFALLLAVSGEFVIIETMIGAILTHLVQIDDPLSASIPAAVFLVAGLVVTIPSCRCSSHEIVEMVWVTTVINKW